MGHTIFTTFEINVRVSIRENIDRHPFSIPLLYTPYVGGYFGNVQQMICSYFGPTLPYVAFMCGGLRGVCHLYVSMCKHSINNSLILYKFWN